MYVCMPIFVCLKPQYSHCQLIPWEPTERDLTALTFDGNFMSAGLLILIMHIYGRSEGSHSDLAMQALVWHHMVRFRAIQFSPVHFDASYTNLRQPRILKHQI